MSGVTAGHPPGRERISLGAIFRPLGTAYPNPVTTAHAYRINYPPLQASLTPLDWTAQGNNCNGSQPTPVCHAIELLSQRTNHTDHLLFDLRAQFRAKVQHIRPPESSISRNRRQAEAIEALYNFMGIASEREVDNVKEVQIQILDNEDHLAKQVTIDEITQKRIVQELQEQTATVLDAIQQEINETALFDAIAIGNLSTAMQAQSYLNTASAYLSQQEVQAALVYSRLLSMVAQSTNGHTPVELLQYTTVDIEPTLILPQSIDILVSEDHLEVMMHSVDTLRSAAYEVNALEKLLVRGHPDSSTFLQVVSDHSHIAAAEDNTTAALSQAQVDACFPPSLYCGHAWIMSPQARACIEYLYIPDLTGIRDHCTHALVTNVTKPLVQTLHPGQYLLANIPSVREMCISSNSSITHNTVTFQEDVKYTVRCGCIVHAPTPVHSLRPSYRCSGVAHVKPTVAVSLFLSLIDTDSASWHELERELRNVSSAARIHLPHIGISTTAQVALDGSRGRIRELVQALKLRPFPHSTTSLLARLTHGSMSLVFRIISGATFCLGLIALVVACLARRQANAVRAMLLPSLVTMARANPFSDVSAPPISTPHPVEQALTHTLTATLLQCFTLFACVVIILMLVPRLWRARSFTHRSTHRIHAIISDGFRRVVVDLVTMPPHVLVDIPRVAHTLYDLPTQTECSLHITEPRKWSYRLELLLDRETLRAITTSTTLMTIVEIPHQVAISRTQYFILKDIIATGHVRMQYFLSQDNVVFIPIREKAARTIRFQGQFSSDQENVTHQISSPP